METHTQEMAGNNDRAHDAVTNFLILLRAGLSAQVYMVVDGTVKDVCGIVKDLSLSR